VKSEDTGSNSAVDSQPVSCYWADWYFERSSDYMQLRAYLWIHALAIKCIQYIFVARTANVWYDILLFASFCTAILSLRYILFTSVYYFDMIVLYGLMRWFSGEIFNSPDTKKPKTSVNIYYLCKNQKD